MTSPIELPIPSSFFLPHESVKRRREALNLFGVSPRIPQPIQKGRVTSLTHYEPLVDDPVAEEELRGMHLVPANQFVEPDDEVDRPIVTNLPATIINLDSVPRYTESSSPKVQSHEGDRLLDVEKGASSTKKGRNCATSRLVQFTAFACFCIGSIIVFGGIALRLRSHS